MSWENCLKRYVIRKEPDVRRALGIKETAKERLNYIKKEFPCFIRVESYYEIVKEFLIALMLIKGLKSRNHECVVSFFVNEYGEMQSDAELIHLLKRKRNEIQYEGKRPKENFLNDKEEKIAKIIRFLESEISKNVDVSFQNKSI